MATVQLLLRRPYIAQLNIKVPARTAWGSPSERVLVLGKYGKSKATLWSWSRTALQYEKKALLKASKRTTMAGYLGQIRRSSSEPDKDLKSEPRKKLSASVSKALSKLTPHENIYTIPNILTATRLIAAPIVGYLVLHDYHAAALGLFAYAGITDLVDGWVARKWKLQTVLGTVLDPMADKMLMTILTVCLAIKGGLPIWLAAIILGRDVGLGFSALYFRWISLPPPKTFIRYWDFSLPSAEVHPTTISKYNTALQLMLIGATTALPLIPYDVGTAMTVMQYIVATTTIWSGASYIYTKDAVKILNQKQIFRKLAKKEIKK